MPVTQPSCAPELRGRWSILLTFKEYDGGGYAAFQRQVEIEGAQRGGVNNFRMGLSAVHSQAMGSMLQ
jgi:hypothetical protein